MYKPETADAVMLGSELESAFAGSFCQFRYTSVVKVAAAVEYDLGDSLVFCSFSYDLANFSGRFLVSAVTFKRSFKGGCCYERLAFRIIDYLRDDVVR